MHDPAINPSQFAILKKGLTPAEVRAQRQKFGYNEFDENKLSAAVQNILKIVGDPMGLMLLVLSIIYWVLGEHHDAIILLAAYIPIAGVDVLLELRSQKALRSLKRTLKSVCFVIRDEKMTSIAIRDLVPGDLLVLEEGQAIPADGKLIEASNLSIDESSLTGESLPIEKSSGQPVLSGTTVLTGRGIVEIKNTGFNSQIGAIAKVLKEFEAVPSPLLRTVNKIVKIAFLIALGVAALVFVDGLLTAKGLANSLISALTLAMAAIPEEFPLVFTLYLSMAAYRLSKKGVLVKSLPAVEGLGRVEIICTDKTGTLTEGRFRLEKLITLNQKAAPGDLEMQALIFSCEISAVDAMEASIFDRVRDEKGTSFVEDLHNNWQLKFDYPFDTKEKYMSHVWLNRSTNQHVMAMKGALEGVLNHCDISNSERFSILATASKEAEAGRRLLGLATRVGNFTGERVSDEKLLKFICILSFSDPVRPNVNEAIRRCVEQGIKIKMLTGDHLLTAHSIADKINLPHEHDQLFTGPDLESLDPLERRKAFQNGVIFARLKPEQKLEMVEALKSGGHVVAMTGDGINDAPALKLADVGISMGERATDVARSTAQLVLLKNDFSGIVAAVLEGRRVLESLRQSFGYLIAFHIPVVGIAIFQAFFLKTAILLPIHIVLMELIVHPVSAFVFDEPREAKCTHGKDLVTKRTAFWSASRGTILTGLCLAVFFFAAGTTDYNRSLAVLALVTGNIGLLVAESGGVIAALRSPLTFRRTWMAAVALLSLALALAYIPALANLFTITKPGLTDFAIVSFIGVLLGAISNEPSTANILTVEKLKPSVNV